MLQPGFKADRTPTLSKIAGNLPFAENVIGPLRQWSKNTVIDDINHYAMMCLTVDTVSKSVKISTKNKVRSKDNYSGNVSTMP